MCEAQNPLRRRLLVAAAALVTMFTIAACNTMEGAGRDVEAAGETVQDAADGR